MIVNLGSNEGKNNDKYSCQLTRIHNLLLMSIVEIPKKYLSKVDRKSDMRKLRTPSVKSS